MRVLKIIVSLTLGISAVLIFLFGAQVIAVTVQVMDFEGYVDLTGLVEDLDGEPLPNVTVTCEGALSLTRDDGSFLLENVSVGMKEIVFYRSGYIGTRIGLLVYPEEDGWIGNDDGSSPNTEFENDPVVMYEELEWIELDRIDQPPVLSNKTIEDNMSELSIEFDRDKEGAPILIELFNGSKMEHSILIENGSKMVSIVGDFNGIYDLMITGEDILDFGIKNVTLGPDRTLNISLKLQEQGFMEYRSGLSVSANIFLGISYLVMGLLIGFGTFISIKKGLWTPLIVLAMVGFFSRDPFGISLNIVSISSLIALICTIMMRKYTRRSYGTKVNPAI